MSAENGSTSIDAVTSYSVDELGIATIRLERARARNAINTQMLVELLEHLAVAQLKRMLHEWDDVVGRSAAEGRGQVEWQQNGPGLPSQG